MDDYDDNIFDSDDALDYILYEDSEKDVRERKKGGCLSAILILTAPAWLLTHYIPLTMNQRTWQQALESASLLSGSYCGLTDGSIAGDWRLPNIRELQSLIDYSQFNPSLPIDHPFGAVSGEFWSSTTNTLNTHHAWVVNFINFGIFFGIVKSDNYQVRAVRDGL